MRKQARALVTTLDAEHVRTEVLRRYATGEIWLAYEMLRAAPRAVAVLTARDLDALSIGMASWAHVDCFASFASGVAWRLGRITDTTIARWARSGDRWRRRAALVSTVTLNCRARGATTPHVVKTLVVCEQLLDDRDDMVVKAMSWALRELAKRDAAPVRRFLRDHADRIAARVVREVSNKLATGLKTPTRRRNPAPRGRSTARRPTGDRGRRK